MFQFKTSVPGNQDVELPFTIKNVAYIPQYESNGASGMDIRADIKEPMEIQPGRLEVIPTGLSFAIPYGYEIQIRSRSGLAKKSKLFVLNTPGTIDSDYRGEVQILLFNVGQEVFTVQPGDRIAQMVLCPVAKAVLYKCDSLDETSRGSGGFGSTGLK